LRQPPSAGFWYSSLDAVWQDVAMLEPTEKTP
jgi:hypothetical protein